MKHHDLFRFRTNRAIHVLGIFAALSLVHVQVSAQAGPIPMPKRLDRFHVVVDGNIVKANYLDGYEGYGVHPYTKAQMNGASVPGGVSLSKQLAIQTKNGLVVADATQRISARQIAKGIGAVAGGPLGLALLAAPAIISLLDQSGLDVENGQVVGPAPGQYQSDGTYWRTQQTPTGYGWTPEAACKAFLAGIGGNFISYSEGICSGNSGAPNYYPRGAQVVPTTNPGYSCPAGSWVSGSTCSPTPQNTPLTPQAIEDAIAAQNPTPEALRDLTEIGQNPPMPDPADKPEIKNPTPSQEKTTTKTNPDGSTDTEVCKTNATPSLNTLKLTETCTLTKRDPSGNVTETSTKTSEDGTGTADTEPSMLCTLFPKIVACAELDTPTDEIPEKTETVDFDAENIGFGPGQCPPPFTWNDSLGQHEIDLSAYCDGLETYIQPIVVLMAAFAAFMIVAGGINRD